MKGKFLKKIRNPVVRKELESLFNNGFKLKEEQFEEFISGDIKSNYLQVFPTVNEREIVRNINLDLSDAGNIFLLVKADHGLHWKATELVKFISEKTDAKVVWNFEPSGKMENIMKIITISY
jgi:hypothetical protein